jgi:hemerythrin-like domain-containing protein
MSPTQLLKEEHQVILRMLKVLSTAADRMSKGQEISPTVFTRALDFIRQFADRCHHGKEEDHLFTAIEEKGIPRQGGPVGVMLDEHEDGRKAVRMMAEGLEKYQRGNKDAKTSIVRGARDYVYVLRNHIPKEDDILYPMADEVLDPQTQQELLHRFQEVDKERLGEGRREYYLKLVEELEQELDLKA